MESRDSQVQYASLNPEDMADYDSADYYCDMAIKWVKDFDINDTACWLASQLRNVNLNRPEAKRYMKKLCTGQKFIT